MSIMLRTKNKDLNLGGVIEFFKFCKESTLGEQIINLNERTITRREAKHLAAQAATELRSRKDWSDHSRWILGMIGSSATHAVLPATPNGAYPLGDGDYRYALWRRLDRRGEQVLFVCLNPSTANEADPDPTLRRCVAYAEEWGCGGVWLGNLFAYRSPKPSVLRETPDPVGPENDDWLITMSRSRKVARVVAAWGNHGRHYPEQAAHVIGLIPKRKLCCLKLTSAGYPAHPLYLPGDLRPRPFASELM